MGEIIVVQEDQDFVCDTPDPVKFVVVPSSVVPHMVNAVQLGMSAKNRKTFPVLRHDDPLLEASMDKDVAI